MKRRFLAQLLFAGFLLFAFVGCGAPKDDKIVSTFRSHRAEFDQLLAMIQKDEKVTRITAGSTIPEDLHGAGISPERLARYRDLIKRIGLVEGIHAYETVGGAQRDIEFIIYRDGSGAAHGERGIRWSTNTFNEAVYHLVDNVDRAVTDMAQAAKANGEHIPNAIFQKPIEGNWKVYFSNL